ncbi:MAG: thiamine phosphate synthase, partial [Elusimicrobiota bacterium]|nr:thiamine phosphate synthase [Elusimicrobiota bacterium]
MENNVERIIDASLNRCREGLRVIEDALRFVLNDDTLYKEARTIRHESDKILRGFHTVLISSRDTANDSGRKIPETQKKELGEIIAANFKRSAEALRTLEEYSKVFSPIHSVDFKAQRYKVYNLE